MTLEEFVAARGQALLRLAWMLTADPDAAQDVVQDALARVLPRWSRIAAAGDPEPYVRQAIRSVWVDAWRRSERRPVVVPDALDDLPDGGGPDPAVEGTAVRLAVGEALTRLTPHQRAVLVLRFYEDLTETATADVLGCSVSTVKSQTRHALARLRLLAPDLVLLQDPVAADRG
ncbi:SigE family RNA polymerase sigma factor [Kineosporia sp. R_H_3]|uniref:SigE family RNA polymerase sigma factor n=1 Tax=Kineosporia sp. R_H_3 TaxID=1961848 RepID=UPI0018EA0AFD|nr:SigE family RNA polymerase sigma factor [Kineosporia sp. R_H_3]